MATLVHEEISVIVVDGVLDALHRLGFPLTALVSMQEADELRPPGMLGAPPLASPSSGVAAARHRHHDRVSKKSKKRRLRRKIIKAGLYCQSSSLLLLLLQEEECHSEESFVCL